MSTPEPAAGSEAPRHLPGALVHLLWSLSLGVLVAALAWRLFDSGALTTLCGFVGFYVAFTVSGWILLHGLDAEETRRVARREMLPASAREVMTLVVTLGGVAGIQLALVLGHSPDARIGAALALLGVFGGWASMHLMYTTRYAEIYYTTEGKAIDFNDDEPPQYSDFFYFSYNLGMTYQVSDTAVCDRSLRGVVLRHCLFSYVFGAVILASTVNLVGQIASG